MENMQIPLSLIKSKIRRELLGLFFTNPESRYYARQLQSMLKVSIGSLHRELCNLEDQGILASEPLGNLKLYSVNMKHPLYQELKAIIFKTVGVEGRLRNVLNSIDGIEMAIVYGSFAAGTDRLSSDIDLFLIGDFDVNMLNKRLSEIESALSREINYVHMSKKELVLAKKAGDALIERILKEPKLPLIGDMGGL